MINDEIRRHGAGDAAVLDNCFLIGVKPQSYIDFVEQCAHAAVAPLPSSSTMFLYMYVQYIHTQVNDVCQEAHHKTQTLRSTNWKIILALKLVDTALPSLGIRKWDISQRVPTFLEIYPVLQLENASTHIQKFPLPGPNVYVSQCIKILRSPHKNLNPSSSGCLHASLRVFPRSPKNGSLYRQ